MKNRIIVYFKKPALADRWFFGDSLLRKIYKVLFKKDKVGSLEIVFLNLCKGFDLLHVPYLKNLPFEHIIPSDRIIVLGIGKEVLDGYNQPNKIIAGIGLMTHPAEWPDLFQKKPIATYLQHSSWTLDIYKRWFGAENCKIWPVGIDTAYWNNKQKTTLGEVLIYQKFLWDQGHQQQELLHPICKFLSTKAITYRVITYGSYNFEIYKEALAQASAMIFLCEHESQGMAYQEAMSMDVPIFAWKQGFWLDPSQQKWGEKQPVVSSSVPYFDESCGETFLNLTEFEQKWDQFYEKVIARKYQPRNFVLANLSLQKSTARMIQIIEETYGH